ncbi:MAG: hypothetical protein JNL59_13890, partial [Chitinophagaceae bacterium]|nr:hypothetical protein [Chitinophagaceae bacterium]
QRQPMNATERRAFIKKFGVGIVMVSITYLFLTIIRDIRDNYMVNIWSELGYKDDYSLFARSETQISLILLGTMALLALIRKNIEAFRVIHVVIAIGFILAGVSSWLFIQGLINGRLWMQLVGLGLYMSYIPFNCIFFERMIAAFRIQGNVGFLIYIADAFGYLGSVTIMLTKEFMDIDPGWAGFYSHAVVIGSLISLAGIMASWGYFNKKYYTQNSR